MKYFMNTKCLEGTQKKWFGKTKPTIDLISIGIISEDNREYYVISKDFNLKEAWNRHQLLGDGNLRGKTQRVYWLRKNVLKPIFNELWKQNIFAKGMANTKDYVESDDFTYKSLKRLINKYGKTNKQIAEEIKSFVYSPYLPEIGDIKTNVWMGVETELYYSISKNPIEFYAYYGAFDCVVFSQLFGNFDQYPKGFPKYFIDLKQALDEKWMFRSDYRLGDVKYHPDYPKQTNEHNALSDAKFVKDLYEFLNKV